MIMDEPNYDLEIKCGSDFSFTFQLKNENGDPKDLTGITFRAQLREFAEAASAIDFVCSHNNQGGYVVLSMPHNVTSTIRFKQGVYDVVQYNTDDTRDPVLGGSVRILPSVTR